MGSLKSDQLIQLKATNFARESFFIHPLFQLRAVKSLTGFELLGMFRHQGFQTRSIWICDSKTFDWTLIGVYWSVDGRCWEVMSRWRKWMEILFEGLTRVWCKMAQICRKTRNTGQCCLLTQLRASFFGFSGLDFSIWLSSKFDFFKKFPLLSFQLCFLKKFVKFFNFCMQHTGRRTHGQSVPKRLFVLRNKP